MNSPRWRKLKWMPRILATPPPEPSQQAARILAIQRNIILPVRAMVAAVVFYNLFPLNLNGKESYREVLLETLQQYFIFYIIFNAAAAVLLTLRRFPFRQVQWVVFAVGLVDGVLLAGLSAWTGGGFQSPLFWVFPGLIIINAVSIPLATPQIVLNLSLSAFYLGAGLLNIRVNESDSNQTGAAPHHTAVATFLPGDIINLASLTTKLKAPPKEDGVSQYLSAQLAAKTRSLLSNYTGGVDLQLKYALAEELGRIVTNGSIYDTQRFASVKLSAQTSNLLSQKLATLDLAKLNRTLLLEAYPLEIKNRRESKSRFMGSTIVAEPVGEEGGTEAFILRLSILLLMTVSCYGVQVLSFRQQIAEEAVHKSAARNDELKAAGRLAAEIAHQLKNPLGIINNAVFSLQRGLKEGRTDFSLQMEIIREEIDKSDRILTQLMGYAQLSEGRVEMLSLPEELDRAIAEVLPPGTSFATQTQRDYDPNLPEMLMQRSHLSVVLVNLLQNAREALAGHGNIFVQAHCRNGSAVEIIVGDDGPGIAADKLDKIFEAYVTTKDRGTGLGLAIVKHNVELYGGSVRAESELGKGARFILLFPAKTFIMKVP